MAYLPEFKNDLFISYRRVVNEGPDRWVSSFQQSLHLNLRRLLGDKVVIWRDEEQLHTGDLWRDKLIEALESAAIYLAIISRTYLDSRECRNELDLMLDKLRSAPGKGRRQIFPVFVQPPRSDADLPSELKSMQMRDFFERTDAALGFAEIDARPDCLEFQQRLSRLAQEVTVALERLHGEALSRFVGRVFVADVEPGLYRDRDDLSADLFDRRYRAVPERDYLWSSADIERDIRADLQDALMSIHLVTPAGLRSEVEVEQARHQLILALDVLGRRGSLPPVVWVSSREGASPALQAFLAEVDGPFADQGVEVLVGGLGELKTEVYKRLAPAMPTRPPLQPPAPLVVNADVVALVQEDEYDAFGATRRRLFDQFNVEAIPVLLAGDAARDSAALTTALAASPRCLIFWGAQPEAWLQHLLHLPQLAGHLGPERLAILAAAPDGAAKRQFLTRKARVIRADGDADRELREFFSPTLAAPVAPAAPAASAAPLSPAP